MNAEEHDKEMQRVREWCRLLVVIVLIGVWSLVAIFRLAACEEQVGKRILRCNISGS